MEGLTGPAVNLTLCVKEGRGFGFLQNPIVIVARLNCNTLETNIYPPIAEPQFHEELLWETDKQTLRRLRTGKVPVKVECFTLTRQNQRSKVGTVLLDLRSAHIVAKGWSAYLAPDAWHKMQCGSGRCPELLLCLRVEDLNESQASGDIVSVKSPRESICTPDRMSSDRLMPNKALIQVGPLMMATEIFQLVVRVESPENLSAFKTWSDIHFTCNLFGTEVRSNFFTREAIGECVVSIRSSLHFLQQYLDNNPFLWIRLVLGREEMGSAQVDITSLVPTASLPDFLELYADSDRVVETKRQCIIARKQISAGDMLADMLIRLKHCQSEVKEPSNLAEQPRSSRMEAAGDREVFPTKTEHNTRQLTPENPPGFSDTDIRRQPANTEHSQKPKSANNIPHQTIIDDFWQIPTDENSPPTNKKSCEQPNSAENSRPLASTAKSREPTGDAPALTSASESRLLNVGGASAAPALIASEPALGTREFRSFSLHVEVQSVQLHRRLPEARRLRFALRHPQAQAIVDGLGEVEVPPPGAITALPDVACRLRFVTTADEISRLLLVYPPKVSMQCADGGGGGGHWTVLASAALDTSRLLAERRRVVFPAPLLDAQGAEVGVLYVALDLRDDGARRERGRRVGPAVLDDRIAHEAVEELEEWKERQQEHFKAQLAEKEVEHLEQLTSDFQRRCADQEYRLEHSVKQTEELTDRLEREAGESAGRAAALVRAQASLELRAEQLEQRFKAQVQALRDASSRMEDDFLHKAKMTENRCVELEAVTERLEKENAALKKSLQERDKELFATNLTQVQTASILQDMRVLEEKLDEAARSKAYFKEQWLQVARELHSLKTEHHTQMQMQIRDSKQTIQALGFQRLLNKEAEELSSDQKLLQQLKSELRNEYPGDESRRSNPCPSSPRSAGNFSKAASLHHRDAEQILHSLIDERDLLLRTGRFTIDDQVIDRINQQIRSQTNLV